ncbi:hypothetical protein [Rhodoferax sp.]|uniref:hypothetical protein n=1 Tax=Rhodoferax sp. TaxID=50421 RepID=UPI002734DC43|nr:hypothetical protein [Rhodoferax sp.]MDP3193573.1 hypothetical protein [Rhodoferax sp.]MDP3337814.1 hypothetical protein [Rhodoferax sp.]
MRASAFIFGTDLLDEGHATVLDNLQQRGGLDSVSFSASYHDARDVFPHNPRRHVFRNEGDVTWFPVDASHYASGLVPRQALAAEGADVLADLCQRAQARGMAVTAWTIFTHNSVLATAHPDCATRNVYGDPYLTDLCPANPRVRSYCCELAADVVRRPVQRLLAESLHYRPLEHGEHHERYLIPLPLEARALMSLCFCTHCRSAATDAGVDVPALAAAMRAALQPVWDGTVLPGQVLLAEAARDALKQYVAVRCATVTSLVAEVRQAIAPSGVPLTFVDHAGTMAHVMHGVVADDDVLSASRRLGIDPVAIAAVADELCVLGYQDTPERLAAVLTRYREALGPQARLSVALRPLLPDCRDEANLRQKISQAVQAGVDGIEFYHYAMMPLNRLDWIRQGLAAAGDLP